jgi:hypothetical protein
MLLDLTRMNTDHQKLHVEACPRHESGPFLQVLPIPNQKMLATSVTVFNFVLL